MILEHKKVKSLDDFFVELSKRKEKGVYLYRINGISEEIKLFLCRYYDAALKNGVVIEGKIPNPTKNNLSYYNTIMGMDFQLSLGFISSGLRKWLPRIGNSQRESTAEAIYDCLDGLRKAGKTENMLKNAYIKFMCWLYYKFERIVNQLGQEKAPKILYEGSVSSYELMLISILANVGCDVIFVQKEGDRQYLSLDPKQEISYEYVSGDLKPFPKNFSIRSLSQEIQASAEKQKAYENCKFYGCTNAWTKGCGFNDILTAPAARGSDLKFFYNCYLRINGAEDKLTYASELYQFYLSLKNNKRAVVIVNGSIPKPSHNEIMAIKRSNNYTDLNQMLAGLKANIQYPSNPDLRGILVNAFLEVITEEAGRVGNNLNKLTGKAVYLLCWIKRYQGSLFPGWRYPDVGCFIYMGGCRDSSEALFMRFLGRLPVDVLILCPNLNERCCLEDRLLYEINNGESLVLNKFPEQNTERHIGTAAYYAERELDTLMYDGTGVYRDKQYAKANTVILQTMDREIPLLWDSELKYRPNFSTVDGMVNIPVIFSKLSGVKDKNAQKYWVSIKQLITQDTIVIDKAPFLTAITPNPIRMHAAEFFKNGRLLRTKIKNHPSYQYGFLREEMQEHLLDKLEALIEQKLIKGTFENGTEYTIISVALNLPKETARMIQKFDFTKKNPKLIYVNTGEALISLEDTIYTVYLSMLGFDVLFFVPTGYNVENYFNKKLMEEHQLGDYMYDLQVPSWDAVSLNTHVRWRDKIFKRG